MGFGWFLWWVCPFNCRHQVLTQDLVLAPSPSLALDLQDMDMDMDIRHSMCLLEHVHLAPTDCINSFTTDTDACIDKTVNNG